MKVNQLSLAVRLLRPQFVLIGHPLPGGIRIIRRECYRPSWYGEYWPNKKLVVISRRLRMSRKILQVLIHELCHAATPEDPCHGPVFAKCALRMGLRSDGSSPDYSPEHPFYKRLKALDYLLNKKYEDSART